MDFASIKSIDIPEGTAVGIAINGEPIWSGGGGGDEPEVLLSWEHVLWSIENNSYNTDYSIGDLIPLDLGTEGNINMQIAGFDVDDLADGTGKAHISFVAKELLTTRKTIGTSTTSSWEESPLRSYLDTTIKPMIRDDVRQKIVQVKKDMYYPEGYTNDYVWIPGYSEVVGSTAIYYDLFPDKTSKAKGYSWWLRRAYTLAGKFTYIKADGSYSANSAATNSYGVCLGFCL